MKDVIYFLSSCLSGEDLGSKEEALLQVYFEELSFQLSEDFDKNEMNEIVDEWRRMYPYAWADFARFLNGWSPGHYKMNEYVKTQIEKVVN